MRAIIFILILAILVVHRRASPPAFSTSIRSAGPRRPQISATGNGVTAKGGQAPAFDVETGSVKVGTEQATVKVPSSSSRSPVRTRPPQATNNAM